MDAITVETVCKLGFSAGYLLVKLLGVINECTSLVDVTLLADGSKF
jgi:hypothetical protein